MGAVKKKTGRPPKDIDPAQVLELAKIQCSYDEMAAVLSCSVSLLKNRFSLVIKEGRENGKASLKRLQWKIAMGGHASMCMFLGKVYCGQREVTKVENVTEGEVVHRFIFEMPDNGRRVQDPSGQSFSELKPDEQGGNGRKRHQA